MCRTIAVVAQSGNVEFLSILKAPAPAARAGFRSAIDRYFEASLYLLIVTGFITLTSTGRLDALSIVAVGSALALRGWLLLRGRALVIPERWTSYLTLVYVLFYAADVFLVSGSFVSATVHLVLFSMVVKIFSVQRERDHLYLAILSFLEVLAAAVLTVDTVFLASFCVFLLLAVSTFVSMEMKRSAAAASGPLPTPSVARPRRRLAVSLSTSALALMLAIFLGTAGIFFILPRLSAGYLSAYAPRNEFVSGFSDHVRLGQIGEIKQSDQVVMHIQIENDRGGFADLKWRGLALANFDGKAWQNFGFAPEVLGPQGRYDRVGQAIGALRFDLARSQATARNLPAARPEMRGARVLSYRVVMEPIGTNVLFLAPVPVSLAGRLREIGVDENGAVFNLDRSRLTESYSAFSILPQPTPAQLRGAAVPYPVGTDAYLQLPRVDARVRELARQITEAKPTSYEKAAALENYLRTHYGYTLQMGSAPPADPLAYFLFQRKEGHCEYFASAMAVMLRTLGIPSRIVNGFRTGEYNDLTGSYIIRGRDAHSWVEAYIPGYAWVTFDPTPADPKPFAGSMHRLALYLDAAREFWREWVINYDFLHQQTVAHSTLARGRGMGDRARLWLRRHYLELLGRARRIHGQAERAPRTWAMGGLALVVIAALLVNAPRLWRAARYARLARNPRRTPQAAASIWYLRMTRRLARSGYPKQPAQTPGEFVAAIADPLLQSRVRAFTRHYESARFGLSADDAVRLPELYEEIKGK